MRQPCSSERFLNAALSRADNGRMPRHKRPKDEILAEHEHLVGLEIWRHPSRKDWEEGIVRDVAVETDGGPAVVTVEFPEAGEIELEVVRQRRRGARHHFIRLRARDQGLQEGDYHWYDLTAALQPPAPPPPTASLRIEIVVQTWKRASRKRQQQIALALGFAVKRAFEDTLGFSDGSSAADLTVRAMAIRRGESDLFDVAIDIEVCGGDASASVALFARLASFLDAAADAEADAWADYLSEQFEDRASKHLDHGDLKKFYASRYTLSGSVGDVELEPVSGRLRLR
jgi:hypothetical protein